MKISIHNSDGHCDINRIKKAGVGVGRVNRYGYFVNPVKKR